MVTPEIYLCRTPPGPNSGSSVFKEKVENTSPKAISIMSGCNHGNPMFSDKNVRLAMTYL